MVTFEERLAEYSLAIEDYIITKDSEAMMNGGNRRHILELLQIHERCGKVIDRIGAIKEKLASVPAEL